MRFRTALVLCLVGAAGLETSCVLREQRVERDRRAAQVLPREMNGYLLACFLGTPEKGCTTGHFEARFSGPGGYTSELECEQGMNALFVLMLRKREDLNLSGGIDGHPPLYFVTQCRDLRL